MSLSYAHPAFRFGVLLPFQTGSTVPSAALLDHLIARLHLVSDRDFEPFAALQTYAFLQVVVPVGFIEAYNQFRVAQ
jgi:hypothetical protein